VRQNLDDESVTSASRQALVRRSPVAPVAAPVGHAMDAWPHIGRAGRRVLVRPLHAALQFVGEAAGRGGDDRAGLLEGLLEGDFLAGAVGEEGVFEDRQKPLRRYARRQCQVLQFLTYLVESFSNASVIYATLCHGLSGCNRVCKHVVHPLQLVAIGRANVVNRRRVVFPGDYIQ
jgi:hypothetical protein